MVMKLIFACALIACVVGKTTWMDLETKEYHFSDYLREFGKAYYGSEFKMRKALFEKNLAEIRAHNKDRTKSWKMGVNHFTDLTVDERKKRLGLNRGMLHREVRERGPVAWNHQQSRALPLNVDWRREGVISTVKDQGGCGGCWTFGSTETVESYWALATGQLPVLSQQFILDCTPNPNDCGGTGGCNGATASLAINTIVKEGGIPQEWTYPYRSYFGAAFPCVNGSNPQAAPFARVINQVHLPGNQLQPVLQTLATTGPLITNVDAGSWSGYESGVYDGCSVNATIDHVVQLIGYGHDSDLNMDYWLIRNSWNPSWGEAGYIRLKRESSPKCGWDNDPGVGNICTGGPSRVQVCGTCGVLYSNSYVNVQV